MEVFYQLPVFDAIINNLLRGHYSSSALLNLALINTKFNYLMTPILKDHKCHIIEINEYALLILGHDPDREEEMRLFFDEQE